MANFGIEFEYDTYKKLIDELFNECNFFGFIVSTYEYIEDFEKNKEYKEYVKKIDEIMDKLNPYLVNTCNTPINFLQMNTEYSREEWENEKYLYDIYFFKTNNETKDILKSISNSLTCWNKPNLPEDLMFIKDDYIKFNIISHENSCNIYCDTLEEYEKLEKIGIEFLEEYSEENEKIFRNNSVKLVKKLLLH